MLNLYRTLRSTRDLADSSTFLRGDSGEFEAVMVLLGVLAAKPRLLGELLWRPRTDAHLGGICMRQSTITWSAVAQGLRPKLQGSQGKGTSSIGSITDEAAADWTSLLDRMAPVNELVTLEDLRPFQIWGPRISQFSFVLSPLAGLVDIASSQPAS